MIRRILAPAAFILAVTSCGDKTIDRHSLVSRNNPHITAIDTFGSLSVGNGRFAFTVDVTGLQSFPEHYSHGVPLGTQSQWGWHSFPNPEGFVPEDAFMEFDFGHGHKEVYSCQFREAGRQHDASEWLRINPHRLHLGSVGFVGLKPSDISGADQTLDLWKGEIRSEFDALGEHYSVSTFCHPERDAIGFDITTRSKTPVSIRFPYPTGKHSDDACDWNADEKHCIEIVSQKRGEAIIRHTIDSCSYYVRLNFRNAGLLNCKPDTAQPSAGRNTVLISPNGRHWSLTAEFTAASPESSRDGRTLSGKALTTSVIALASQRYWKEFWTKGGVVDFSRCKDSRSAELERRVVLSQYLLAIQCAGDTPPQETGLTYNSWFGKFHLEMIWWHQAHFALWGHEELLERSLKWYSIAIPAAKSIAERQGFHGARWMKMTDPSAQEAPSNVGSFLIWQQPHPIYLAELVYRARPCKEVLVTYSDIVQQTAEFMADYVSYEPDSDRYVLKGCIAAQETLKADKTVNPPFELSYWHFGLSTAQLWRERQGLERIREWDTIIDKLSPLASKDSLYLAAETEPDTYSDTRMYSDHMAVLGALGVLPATPQINQVTMKSTLDWVIDNWNWDKTWGWDYPMTCMSAVRLCEPEKAIETILMPNRTNTYLPNGHNYQDSRLRCYLPGNGGLLTSMALMCAGWDGCEINNPGFPKDGNWDVRWEGLLPMP